MRPMDGSVNTTDPEKGLPLSTWCVEATRRLEKDARRTRPEPLRPRPEHEPSHHGERCDSEAGPDVDQDARPRWHGGPLDRRTSALKYSVPPRPENLRRKTRIAL